MRARVYLGLGSNLGDRIEYLKKAIKLIAGKSAIEIVGISSVYETGPVGQIDQPSFLNCVMEIETGLPPKELLKVIDNIESGLKRERLVRWGPRTIDIDILLYGDRIVREPDLTIPHPYLCERAFVVVPLLELSSDVTIPGIGKVSECKKRIAEQSIIKLAALNIDDIIKE